MHAKCICRIWSWPQLYWCKAQKLGENRDTLGSNFSELDWDPNLFQAKTDAELAAEPFLLKFPWHCAVPWFHPGGQWGSLWHSAHWHDALLGENKGTVARQIHATFMGDIWATAKNPAMLNMYWMYIGLWRFMDGTFPNQRYPFSRLIPKLDVDFCELHLFVYIYIYIYIHVQ